MTAILLGTSNCIVRNSFVPHFQHALGQPVRNLSIGASSSSVGLYFLDELRAAPGDTVLMDYVINDTGYIRTGLKTPAQIKAQLGGIVDAVRSAGARPLLIIVPSFAGLEQPCEGEIAHLEFCHDAGVMAVNLAALCRQANQRGIGRDWLMRDPAHMSAQITPAIGRILATCVDRLHSIPTTRRFIETVGLRTRRLLCSEMAGVPRYVEHESSLYRAKFAVLREGERLHVPLRPDEALLGVMMNTGGLGANVAFRGAGPTTVKPMTIYWDASNPDWFTAIMVDFLTPVAACADGVELEVAGRHVAPTEWTLHQQPSLEGRYGEVQIEGFLIGARSTGMLLEEVGASPGDVDLLASLSHMDLVSRLA